MLSFHLQRIGQIYHAMRVASQCIHWILRSKGEVGEFIISPTEISECIFFFNKKNQRQYHFVMNNLSFHSTFDKKKINEFLTKTPIFTNNRDILADMTESSSDSK